MPIKYNTEIFINISNKIHNNRYDYSLVEYKNNFTNVKIICSVHGIFEQRPQIHMKGSNCPLCFLDKMSKNFRMDENKFKELSNEVHNNKYDYSLVNYVNQRVKVKIKCPKHGIFEQLPRSHYNNKSGCPFCDISHKSNSDEFIKKSILLHKDSYIYDKVEYLNAIKKVIIICKKHGDFLITPNNHLRGKGCPICKLSYGEREIKNILDNKNIEYIRQKFFKDCIYKRHLKFDFYLPNYNLCIEFDGEQHFKKFRFEINNDNLNIRKMKDKIKDEYCRIKNIHLLRIKYDDNLNVKLNDYLVNNVPVFEIV